MSAKEPPEGGSSDRLPGSIDRKGTTEINMIRAVLEAANPPPTVSWPRRDRSPTSRFATGRERVLGDGARRHHARRLVECCCSTDAAVAVLLEEADRV